MEILPIAMVAMILVAPWLRGDRVVPVSRAPGEAEPRRLPRRHSKSDLHGARVAARALATRARWDAWRAASVPGTKTQRI